MIDLSYCTRKQIAELIIRDQNSGRRVYLKRPYEEPLYIGRYLGMLRNGLCVVEQKNYIDSFIMYNTSFITFK